MSELAAGRMLEFVEAEREIAVRANRRLMDLVDRQGRFWDLTEKLLNKLNQTEAANACRLIAREGHELVAEIREQRGG